MCVARVIKPRLTAPLIVTGKRSHSGFTLIEILLVLVLIALLASLVAPEVTSTVGRAKESAVKQNLMVMRKAIDDYYSDKGKYPERLGVLVEEKYLRSIPKEPSTGRADTWEVVNTENSDGSQGIIDVKSSNPSMASDGTRYKEW
jgi:general secretion pathway protein G